MHPTLPSLDRHFALPNVRRVSQDRPLHWLRLAWHDLRNNPLPGIAYGLLFAIGGDLILILARPHPHLFMTAISGFFLVAPMLAAGLYEVSRQLESGRRITFVDSLACWSQRGQSMAMIGVAMAFAVLLWERLSAVLFALFVAGHGLDINDFMRTLLGATHHSPFLAAWFVVGATLALVVFSVTVVSVPMILDRDTDFATAAMTSLRVVATNLETMFLWAMIIVALTLLGFATLLFGLIVVMPLLGHASWHAYRDLVE